MAVSPDKLKLGKGASFFVKAQLRRLRQEDETWEADFFPIPCSDSEHGSVWWGIVLSHDHDNVLAQRMIESRRPSTISPTCSPTLCGVPWSISRTGHGACCFDPGRNGPNCSRT